MDDLFTELQLLRTGKKAPRNGNDYWSEADEKTLITLFHQAVGISEIAVRLGRTELSVVQRLNLRGEFFQQCRPRSPNKSKCVETCCKCPTCPCTDCKNCGKDQKKKKNNRTIKSKSEGKSE